MKKVGVVALIAAGALLAAVPGFSQSADQRMPEDQAQGRAVVTIIPQHGGATASVSQQELNLKINGKETSITGWVPLNGAEDRVELVFLIDGAARTGLGSQFSDIEKFIQSLPPDVRVTIGYMENGRAALTGPLSTDHAAVLRGLHLPLSIPGVDASPYFSLSDLAKNWPSQDQQARREVVMVTDGVDYYNLRYDPEDPYVQAAVSDSVRAGLVVYSIYWRNAGRVDRTFYENNAGQNLLLAVTQATGGNSYWEGVGNPVSFQPYFQDIVRRLQNQYELSFVSRMPRKPDVETFRLKVSGAGAKIDAPEQVYVGRPVVAGE